MKKSGSLTNRFLTGSPAPIGSTTITSRTCPGFAPLCEQVNGFHYDEAAGPFSWNYAAASQGLNFAGKHLVQDLNGAAIPVSGFDV